MTKEAETPIIIYENADKAVEVRLDAGGDTVWLSLQQLADLFGRDKSVISRHLKNIFENNELERNSVVAKNATTAADGKTYQVEYFNLDAIISVGYRVNSTRATRFRQWATRVLREHLTRGWTLNHQRFETNARESVGRVSPEGVTRQGWGWRRGVSGFASLTRPTGGEGVGWLGCDPARLGMLPECRVTLR